MRIDQKDAAMDERSGIPQEFSFVPLSDADRADILARVQALGPELSRTARAIWSAPELAFEEVQTADTLTALLSAHGFQITRGVAGLPTGFVATAGAGGPILGLMAEMDALPGFSQDAAPYPNPIPGQTKGHACGHHLFGTASVGAGIALAGWLKDRGLPGQVRVYGTPAEEGGSGKVYMARAGLFDDLDLALHWHPDDCNRVWQNRSLASIGAQVTFTGRTAHAAQSPEKGRSALHGVEAFHHMAALMREVVPPQTHIHYVIRHGGEAPNIIPDHAVSQIGVRHPDPEVARDVFDRLERAAHGAALGTGTEVEITRSGGVLPILPNDTVGRVMYANMQTAPAIEWTEAETEYARQIQTSMETPRPIDRIDVLGPYTFDGQGAFSTDVGDLSWLVPCGALGTVTWVPGTRPHTWQAVAAGGTSISDKGVILAAQGLAMTAANFATDPTLVPRARAELEAARGADFRYEPLIGDAEQPLPAS